MQNAYQQTHPSRPLHRDPPPGSQPAPRAPGFAVPPQAGEPRLAANRLRHYAPRVAIALLALVMLSLASVQFARPWLIEQLTHRIPAATVRAASGEALRQLDREWLAPSTLPVERQDELRNRFAALAAPPGGAPAYRLLFRSSERLGARAFTLPGGEVIVTDEMIALASDEREILALLAHQLGMLKDQRRLLDALREAMLPTLVGLYVHGEPHASRSLARRFLQTPESAGQKAAADAYAVDMLRANRIEAIWLASVLQRIEHSPFPERADLPALLEPESGLEARIGAILRELA